MYIGLPGRFTQDALPTFLLSNSFLPLLRARFDGLQFKQIEHGLVLCIDCLPPDGPLSAEIKRPRKVKNTRIRDQTGALVYLPTLHSASIPVDHAGMLRCKTRRDVAVFLSAELRRQAPLLFCKLPNFDWHAFCCHFEAVALQVPDTISGET
jgi:hypothetical protein